MEVDGQPAESAPTQPAAMTATAEQQQQQPEASMVVDSQQMTATDAVTAATLPPLDTVQDQPAPTATSADGTAPPAITSNPPPSPADSTATAALPPSQPSSAPLTVSTANTTNTAPSGDTPLPPESPSAMDALLSDLDDDDDRKRLYRGRWTPAEDALLKQWVEHYDAKNWKRIAESAFGNTKSDVQCLHRWQKVLKPGLIKGPWTKAEDDMVVSLVAKYGVKKWSFIASHLTGRLGKQCRERWFNHLNPDIKKEAWTEEEDKVIVQAHRELGNKWAAIAARLPGRTDNAIKNRWNSTLQRLIRKQENGTPGGGANGVGLESKVEDVLLGVDYVDGKKKRKTSGAGRRAKAVAGGQMSPSPSSSDADDDSEADGLENTNVRYTFGSPSRSPLAPNITSSTSIAIPSTPLFTTPSILRKRSRLASGSPGSSEASPAKRSTASMLPPSVPQFFSPQLPRSKKHTQVLSTPAPRSTLDSLLAASNLDASLSQQQRATTNGAGAGSEQAVAAISATPATASASLSALATLSLHTPNVMAAPAQPSNANVDSGGDPARRSLASTFLSMPGGEDGDDTRMSSNGSIASPGPNKDAAYLSPPRPAAQPSSVLSPNSSLTAGAAVLLASLSNATALASSTSIAPASPARTLPLASPSKPLPSVLSNLLTPPRNSHRDRDTSSNMSYLGNFGTPSSGSVRQPSASPIGGSNVSREFYSPAQQLLAGPLVERDPLCAQAERVLISAAMAAKDRKAPNSAAGLGFEAGGWKRRDASDVMAIKVEGKLVGGSNVGTTLHTLV